MYSESLFWWIGGTVILIVIIGLIGMLAFWVEGWLSRRDRRDDDEPHD